MRNTLYLSIILALSPCSVPLAFAAGADGLEARVSTPIAAQPLARALEQLSRSSGVQFLYSAGGDARMAGAVPRGATVRQALDALLAGTGLGYTVVDGNVIAIDPAPARNQPKPAAPKPREAEAMVAPTLDTVKVIAAHEVIDQKKRSPVIKDSVVYDEMDSYGDETLAESLMAAPGLSAVEDAGEPRYVTVRGVQANLNYTTIDGIAIASVGGSGSGERMNNLQLIPSDIGTRTDIYKSFSAEQAPDAIGGVIDIISRSAFDRSGKYVFADVAGIYSTAETNVERSAGGNHETLGHFGKSAKMVFSNQFGADQEFGIVAVARYEQRSRNSVKRWVESNYYYNDAGKYLTDGTTGPDEAKGWNGLRAPGNFSTGTYTNFITNFGGSAKLEWKPSDDPFYASLLLYSYRFYENSTMNKTDLYGNAKFPIRNQTEDSGTTQINSIYIKNRHDRWDRSNRGAIASFNWDMGDRSRLTLRGGHTEETFHNNQVYWGVRAYPSNLFVDYENDSHGFPNAVAVSDSSLLTSSAFKLNPAQAYVSPRDAKESIDNLRADFSYNIDADARGFGLATGAEYRHLKIWQDIDFDYFKSSATLNDYLYPGSTLLGSVPGFPLIDNRKWTEELLPKLGSNNAAYPNANFTSDYKYVEDITNAYVSAHYAWDRLLLIGGLRYDHTRFDAYSPFSDDGGATYTSAFRNTSGGYNNLLPSLNATFKLTEDQRLRFSASRTLGRPTPSNIAQATSTSCGDDEEGRGFCTIKQGNADLQPRRSTNIDLAWDLYFNGNNGLVSVALFDKVIKDDIYTLTTFENVGDTRYRVTQPMNTDESKLRGVEFAVANRNLQWGRQRFDMYFNATRLEGQTDYRISDGTARRLDRLLYQPDWSLNGSVIWRMPWRSAQLRLSGTYRSRMLVDFGDTEWLDSYYDPYMTFNMAFSHKVGRHVTLKYEAKNLFNTQPTYSTGPNGRFRTEIDDYGRFFYFHIIYN
ncbi:TonB-dependent receptor [Stenotrophomonas maltophilia]|uniref:TonB-dependent receptor n=1 Tax=Stenotrophomonas hibiscicola TaxID=86189 RepID=UPI00106F9869|nr:TonB-dependent receptor [Stenotrophomonas maltophilia]MBA0469105.1 TonB-dependent receptor [Stenotrophomonas maltophilia]MBA0476586.1 TonB-dependent receptor [Stenotrophomonas maltophilia]MBA0486586.1 TonB-dependent receptor [Stenotrophomonas maltophilia]